MIIGKLCKRIQLLYANLTYETKRAYLINQGALIGRKTRMNCNVDAFGSEPYLITVGENCLFASGIHFITHDGAVKVLNTQKRFGRDRMDIIAPIRIGNNVYVGMGAYILPGVTIGDNSIIGAGAVVTKDIPEDSVAAGVPARVLETVDEYYMHVINKNNVYRTAGMDSKSKRKFFEKCGLRDSYWK